MKKSLYNEFVDWRGYYCGINLMTGKKVVVTANEYEKYMTDADLLSPEMYNALVECGFLIENDVDEYARLLHRRNQSVYFNNNSFRLIVLPTLECNFHCWYCYEKHVKGDMVSHGTLERLKRYIDYIIENRPVFNFHLDWFGGEPLLYYYEVMLPVSEYVKTICDRQKISFTNTITTNCYLADERMIRSFADIGLKGFQVTLDGCREKHNCIRFEKRGHDSYGKILENINAICGIIPDSNVTIRINYTNDNISGIGRIADDIKEENRPHVSFSLQRVWQTKNTERDKDIEAELEAEMEHIDSLGIEVNYGSVVCGKGIRCYADTMNEMVVNYDGTLYKCTARNFAKHEGSVGFLDEKGIPVWNEHYYKHCLMTIFDHPKCKSCKYVPVCLGTCSQKYMENGYKAIETECFPEDMKKSIHEDLYNSLYGYITVQCGQ